MVILRCKSTIYNNTMRFDIYRHGRTATSRLAFAEKDQRRDAPTRIVRLVA